MRYFALFFLFLGVSVFAKPTVTVSIAPQKYFVEQIAKDLVIVNVMVPSGASPHSYEPKPSQMKALSSSDAYFAIGVNFEQIWLEKFKATNPSLLFIDTAKGITKQSIEKHHHDNHKDDEHETKDPHIWLDPILVKIQAQNIKDALVKLYPLHVKNFERNYADFIAVLDTLDTSLQTTLKDITNRQFIVFHPSFGYFASRYMLEQISIEVGGKEPKPSELARIIKDAKKTKAKAVFTSPQFSQKSASVIAKEIGAIVFVIDPLSEDWEENIRKIANAFVLYSKMI
ncbi:MAG: zinc ABC transporter substrate-binding protein [Sulfurospirillaceae bacterium]|nr:zinc ABC transporter substrate-binding protein [Sulfurospirillaceae bacterium]